MKTSLLLTAAAMLAIAGCGGGDQHPATPENTKQPWEEFVADTITAYYERNPESAVGAGLHEYDGRMGDRSLAGLDGYAKWLDAVITEASSYTDLEGIAAFERDYLLTEMNDRLFWLRDSDYPTKNPLFYSINVGVYVDRDYAPLEARMVAYTEYIAQVPGLLETMRRNLEPPLPAPYLEIGSAILGGFAGCAQAHAPEYMVNLGVSYSSARGLFARVDVAGKDGFYYSDSHDQRAGNSTLVNGRVGYEAERWSVYLWGRNVFDEVYTVRGFYFANEPPDWVDKLYTRQGDPRQLGLTIDYRY